MQLPSVYYSGAGYRQQNSSGTDSQLQPKDDRAEPATLSLSLCVCVCVYVQDSCSVENRVFLAYIAALFLRARFMHRSLARAYNSTPHSLAATVKALRHLSYHMPARRCLVVARIARWLGQHAYWDGDCYSSWCLPDTLVVGGICGAWNDDFSSLGRLLDVCTDDTFCCHRIRQHSVCV